MEEMKTEDAGEQKRLRILAVDDEENIQVVMQEFLVSEGYEVRTAGSGPEALGIIGEFKPHIIFLDIRMPDMDGLQSLRRIREIDQTVEVVMISGFATIEIARRSLEIGAADYIGKPMDFSHIRKVIRHITQSKFVEFL